MEVRIIKFNGSSAFLEVFKNNRSSNDRYNTLKIETPKGKKTKPLQQSIVQVNLKKALLKRSLHFKGHLY